MSHVIIASLMFCLVLMSSSSHISAQEAVPFPKDWRGWTHIASTVVMNEKHPAYGIRHVYANDTGKEAALSGAKSFPEGSELIMVTYKIKSREVPGPKGIKSTKLWMDDARNLDLMTKNSGKYSKTGGWNYARFDLSSGAFAKKQAYARCFGCHNKRVKDKDFIFSRARQ